MINQQKYKSLLPKSERSNYSTILLSASQNFIKFFVFCSVIVVFALSIYVIQITDFGKTLKPWESLPRGSINLHLKGGDGIIISPDEVTANVNTNKKSVFVNDKNQLSILKYLPGVGLSLRSDGKTLDVNTDFQTLKINNQNQIAAVQSIPGNGLKLNNDGITFDLQFDNDTIVINSDGKLSIPPPPVFIIPDKSINSFQFADNSITDIKFANQSITRSKLSNNLSGQGIYQTVDNGLNINVDNKTIVINQSNILQVGNKSIGLDLMDANVNNQVNAINAFSNSIKAIETATQSNTKQISSIQQFANTINDTLNYVTNQIKNLQIKAGNGINITNNTIGLLLDQTTLTVDSNSSSLKLSNQNNFFQYNDSYGKILQYKPLAIEFGNATGLAEVFPSDGSGPLFDSSVYQPTGFLQNHGLVNITIYADMNQYYIARANFTGLQLPSSPNTANGIFCDYYSELNTNTRFTNAASTSISWAGLSCDATLFYSSQYMLSQVTFVLTMLTDTFIPANTILQIQYSLF